MSLNQIQSGMPKATAIAPPPVPPQTSDLIVPQNEEQEGVSDTAVAMIDTAVETAGATVASETVNLAAEDADFIAEELNKSIAVLNSHVSFAIDDATDRTIIKVTDTETGELIRQVPPEVMLKLLKRMTEMVGLLMDEKA